MRCTRDEVIGDFHLIIDRVQSLLGLWNITDFEFFQIAFHADLSLFNDSIIIQSIQKFIPWYKGFIINSFQGTFGTIWIVWICSIEQIALWWQEDRRAFCHFKFGFQQSWKNKLNHFQCNNSRLAHLVLWFGIHPTQTTFSFDIPNFFLCQGAPYHPRTV